MCAISKYSFTSITEQLFVRSCAIGLNYKYPGNRREVIKIIYEVFENKRKIIL